MLQLLAQLLLLAQLGGVDHVAGRHVGQHPGHHDVLIRPLPRLRRVEVQGADHLVGKPHRDPGHASHTNAGRSFRELRPSGRLLPNVAHPNRLTGVVGVPTRASLLLLLNALQLACAGTTAGHTSWRPSAYATGRRLTAARDRNHKDRESPLRRHMLGPVSYTHLRAHETDSY